MTRAEALRIRAAVEQASASLDDKTASTAAALFPRLKQSGELIKAGTRISHNGSIKRAAADLWDTAGNSPDNAPTLWEDIDYRDGCRIIPAVITAAAAFETDECGWWGDTLYRSRLPANVYTPEQYPAGWEKIS